MATFHTHHASHFGEVTIHDEKALENGVIQITSTELPALESDTASVSSASTKIDDSPTGIATKILRVIEKYGLNHERTGSWDGFETFLPVVVGQVERKEPIRMLLPGFPFKSPNTNDKVLGVLPDLGEELALKHLNGLAENVAAIYEHGAEIHITSDGLVYNDLLGVTDETVWNFGQAVRAMADEHGLKHLSFLRLWDLLEHPGDFHSKEYYLAHASCIRRELKFRFGDPQFEADMANKSTGDMQMTHTKYLEFLQQDLALNEKHLALSPEDQAANIANTAKEMMGRWRAFSTAMAKVTTPYVRLSIHDSGGADKLSMALIPQPERGALGATPWHSTLVVELDGTFRTVQSHKIDKEKYQLVYRNGRPYFYRAKSELFNWIPDGLNVTFEHLYPTGLIIRPVTTAESNPSPTIYNIPMKKVRELTHKFSPVVLRGFSETTDEKAFLSSANELGKVLVWPQYGILAKVKDAGRNDPKANNVTSNEAMPMHFDGIFKYSDVTDPATGEVKKVLDPPGYQYFTCIETAPKGSGYTLFAASRLLFRYLPQPWTLERLEPVTWGTDNTGFWKQIQEGLDLVIRHPDTNEPCLRWHEPWNDTKYSTCKVTIENEDQSLINVINECIYDWRICLRFSWEKGDLLVSDNKTMLHTRSAYQSDCDREMWRIHFD